MLVEIHVLQNLAPSNPNRDDVGAPKSAIFGGRLRGRISSQCIKRSIRLYPEFKAALKDHLGERTKLFPERVRDQLAKTTIPAEEHARIVLVCTRIGKADAKDTGKKEKEKVKPDGKKRTPQLIYLGAGEVEEFVTRLVQLRGEMPDAYKYYLNPVAGFQEVMTAAVEASGLNEKEDKATRESLIKNAWVIAKLRMDRLAKFTATEEPEPLPERAGPEPGEADATWIVERVELLAARDDAASKGLLKEVLGKVTTKERPLLEDAAPDKPADYTQFKKRIDEPLQNKSVDIALFGRMTTEAAAFEDMEACLEVAHAISTNEMAREVDYFTAMDDDPHQKGPGAAHIGENEFTSNCYYKYFSLDWDAFVTQLADGEKARTDAQALARTALKELIRAAVCAIPTGKKKGHANNNLPEAVLVEVKKKRVPTSYANAFLKPAVPSADGSPMDDSIRKLGHYAKLVSRGYSIEADRFWFDLHGRALSYIVPVADGKPEKQEPYADAKIDLDGLLNAVDEAVSKGVK